MEIQTSVSLTGDEIQHLQDDMASPSQWTPPCIRNLPRPSGIWLAWRVTHGDYGLVPAGSDLYYDRVEIAYDSTEPCLICLRCMKQDISRLGLHRSLQITVCIQNHELWNKLVVEVEYEQTAYRGLGHAVHYLMADILEEILSGPHGGGTHHMDCDGTLTPILTPTVVWPPPPVLLRA